MRLVLEREERRAREREEARLAARDKLRSALGAVCAGGRAYVFGSITRPGRFFRVSDVDVALERLPEGFSQYGLTGLLEEEMGRPVDVLLLGETRLREKILREGERWTL